MLDALLEVCGRRLEGRLELLEGLRGEGKRDEGMVLEDLWMLARGAKGKGRDKESGAHNSAPVVGAVNLTSS